MLKRFLFACLTLCFFIFIPSNVSADNKIIRKKTIRNATITAGNRLTVFAKGKTINTKIMDGGIEDVFSGAVSRKAQVFNGGRLWLAGGKSYDAVVHDGGLMEVREHNHKSSYSANTKLLPGGRMNVFNHSLAEKITVGSNGFLRVYFPKAVISDVTILSGGLVHVWKHGTAQNVYVAPGGVLELREESPVLKGTIRVAGQLKVSFDHDPDVSQAKISLDLTQRSIDDDYAIINLDYMKNANISVNISADQKCGLYKLASRAEKWKKPWTVIVNNQRILHLFPGKPVNINGKTYTLNKGNNCSYDLSIAQSANLRNSQPRTFFLYKEKGPLHFGLGNVSEFTFDDSTIKSGFICCIGGMKSSDWMITDKSGGIFAEYVHPKIYDAEKIDLISQDDYWCEQLTVTNMLNWCKVLNYAGYQNEVDFVDDLLLNLPPKTSVWGYVEKYKGVRWGNWAHYTKIVKDSKFELLKQTDAHLRNGAVSWFQIYHGTPKKITGGHAITLLGFTYNTNYTPDDPRYYSGVILANSDDNKRGYDHIGDSPKRISIERLIWDKEIKNYWYKGVGKHHIETIWTFVPPKISGAADLTWYRPNDWTNQMTVNSDPNSSGDYPVLWTDETLYLNFAITNQGKSTSGNFYVTLFIDNRKVETFKVDSMKSGDIAVIQNYKLGKLSAGKHIIKAIIDSGSNVSEAFEKNNSYIKNIIVSQSGTPIRFGKGEGFLISQNATVKNIEIHSNARVYVRGERALLKNASVEGKAFIRIANGGTTLNTQIKNGGIEDVFSGGVSRNAVVKKGGRLWLAGGKSFGAIIHDGGIMEVRPHRGKQSYARDIKILSGGRLKVYNGALAENITISSGGRLRVWKDGTAKNMIIESGGLLELRGDAPVLKGTIHIAGQLKASYDQNPDVSQAQITIDLTQRSINDDYAIINLDYMKNANISVNISRNQKIGSYKIASGTTRWNDKLDITVDGRNVQSIRLWKPVQIAGKYYTLNRVNYKFIELTVSLDPPASEELVPELEISQKHKDIFKSYGLEIIAENYSVSPSGVW